MRTREEYKQAKAEELQRKRDEEKRAKDEKRRIKEDGKRKKAEENGAKEGKAINQEKNKADASPVKYERVRIRLIPIWLRLILLVALIFISTTVGAVVGYGMLGNGKPADVFKESTWTHIRDLVDKGK
jgi:hypothetical protein